MGIDSNSGLVVLAKEGLEQRTDETLTKSEGLEPQRKKVEPDTLSSRIVLVCPYSQIGAGIEGLVPKIITKAEIDSISEAETNYPPHIDIRARERNRKSPYWVIDFNRIIIEAPNREAVYQANQKALQILTKEFGDVLLKLDPNSPSLQSYDLSEQDYTKVRQGLLGLLGKTFDKRFRKLRDEALSEVDKSCLVERVANFYGYSNWSQGKILVYIAPKIEISESLKAAETYDESENFIRGGVAVAPYIEDIRQDLLDIAKGKTGEFRFFWARK